MLSIPAQPSTVRADSPEIPASTYDSQFDSLKSLKNAPDTHGYEPLEEEYGDGQDSTVGKSQGYETWKAGLGPVDRIQGHNKRPLQNPEQDDSEGGQQGAHTSKHPSSHGSTGAMDTTCGIEGPVSKTYQAVNDPRGQQYIPHRHRGHEDNHPKRRKMSNIIHPVEVGEPSDEDSS